MKIRILDIDWDLYDENSGKILTPKQAGVPEYVDIEVPDGEDVDEAAERYMDKNFNWCNKGFSWEADPKGWGKKPRAGKKSGKKKSKASKKKSKASAGKKSGKKKSGKRKSKASAAKNAEKKREKVIDEVLYRVRGACQYAMDNHVMRDSELEEIEWLLRQNLK